jgi:UDP:flavonoid glycosyltransferase YjiC (YdhE family)
LGTVLKMIEPALDRSIRMLEERYVPGETMLVGHPLSFYARILEDQHKIPAATIHLAPSSIRSAHQVPALPPGVDISRLPRWLKDSLWWAVDRFAVDPLVVPEVNRLRAASGLPPVQRVFKDWINSPRLVIGLFPGWYAAPQPDWPSQIRLAGFGRFDGALDGAPAALPDDVRAFCEAGPPPIAFTLGTGMTHAAGFFRKAVAACDALGARGLLLTKYPHAVPVRLPPGVRHCAFAPFREVLPLRAAIVHPGRHTWSPALSFSPSRRPRGRSRHPATRCRWNRRR